MPSEPRDHFLYFRYMSYVAVVTSVFGAGLMFFLAVVKTIKAYVAVLHDPDALMQEKSTVFNESVALVVQSIDAFMIGMVFMMFAYGVATLFIKKVELPEGHVFRWVKIGSMNHLKVILGEMIIIVLFVKFLEVILLNDSDLTFEILVLPVGIVLLALALKFLDLDRTHQD